MPDFFNLPSLPPNPFPRHEGEDPMRDAYLEQARTEQLSRAVEKGEFDHLLHPRWRSMSGGIQRAVEAVKKAMAAQTTPAPLAPGAVGGGSDAARYVWPIEGLKPGEGITNPFGGTQYRHPDFLGALPEFNTGLDIAVPGIRGRGVLSPITGRIVEARSVRGDQTGWGNHIVIEGANGDRFLLAHLLDEPTQRVGEQVQAGQRVNRVGSTGNTISTVPGGDPAHLNIEYIPKGGTKRADPMGLTWGTPMADTAPQNTVEQLRKRASDLSAQLTTLRQTAATGGEFERAKATEAATALEQQLTTILVQLDQAENRQRDDARVPPTVQKRGDAWMQWNPTTQAWVEIGREQTRDTDDGTIVNLGQVGGVWLVKRDGTKTPIIGGQAAPPSISTSTQNGRMVGVNQQTGQVAFNTDLLSEEERRLNDELAQYAALEQRYKSAIPEFVNSVLGKAKSGDITFAEAAQQIGQFKSLFATEADRLAAERDAETKRANAAREQMDRLQLQSAQSDRDRTYQLAQQREQREGQQNAARIRTEQVNAASNAMQNYGTVGVASAPWQTSVMAALAPLLDLPGARDAAQSFGWQLPQPPAQAAPMPAPIAPSPAPVVAAPTTPAPKTPAPAPAAPPAFSLAAADESAKNAGRVNPARWTFVS